MLCVGAVCGGCVLGELNAPGSGRLSADAAVWGSDALSLTGSAVLLRGWESACALFSECFATPACSSFTLRTARVHAWVDALVLGTLAS